MGTDHQVLLDEAEVLVELDEADRTELMTAELEDRQVWAELLAFRLCHKEPQA